MTTIGCNLQVRKTATYSGFLFFEIVLLFLLLSNLCYLAGDFEGCGCAVSIGYGDFCFARAAGADGDGKGGTVCVAWSALFDDINLDRMESEDLQRKENLMAAGDSFAVVGIDKLPLICSLTGKLLNRKRKFVDALGKGFRWQRCGGWGYASAQQQKQGNACANNLFHCYPPISALPMLITVLTPPFPALYNKKSN